MSGLGSGRSKYRLYQMAWDGLDFLIPPYCGGCGELGARWCEGCQANTRIISYSFCERCGDRLESGGVCSACMMSPPSFIASRSWAEYQGPLRLALHRLKYKRDIALGEVLARPLIGLLEGLKWNVDIVVPVPAWREHQSSRGYNQAALLALPLALGCGINYRPKALKKIRETSTQVGLNFEQRQKNVAGAFVAIKKQVDGKRVLVIDDIKTSGSTIGTCSDALMNAGVDRVYVLTLARTNYFQYTGIS